jgi:hypothetical protein
LHAMTATYGSYLVKLQLRTSGQSWAKSAKLSNLTILSEVT